MTWTSLPKIPIFFFSLPPIAAFVLHDVSLSLSSLPLLHLVSARLLLIQHHTHNISIIIIMFDIATREQAAGGAWLQQTVRKERKRDSGWRPPLGHMFLTSDWDQAESLLSISFLMFATFAHDIRADTAYIMSLTGLSRWESWWWWWWCYPVNSLTLMRVSGFRCCVSLSASSRELNDCNSSNLYACKLLVRYFLTSSQSKAIEYILDMRQMRKNDCNLMQARIMVKVSLQGNLFFDYFSCITSYRWWGDTREDRKRKRKEEKKGAKADADARHASITVHVLMLRMQKGYSGWEKQAADGF